MNSQNIDHIDIVVSHQCNMMCKDCIDKFRGQDDKIVKLKDIENFLKLIREHTDEELEVLLLGGDPTVVGSYYLIEIAKLVKKYNFRIIMSTNGLLKGTVKDCLPYFDSIQITTHSNKETDYWRQYSNKINIKLSGDQNCTLETLNHFIAYTKDFYRRSVSMYFTPDFEELCKDERVWALLNTLTWQRNGSYEYAFYKGVRFKRCIHGQTNIIDEPTVPKLYPNGNYNKTWNNEELDAYLGQLTKEQPKVLKKVKKY